MLVVDHPYFASLVDKAQEVLFYRSIKAGGVDPELFNNSAMAVLNVFA